MFANNPDPGAPPPEETYVALSVYIDIMMKDYKETQDYIQNLPIPMQDKTLAFEDLFGIWNRANVLLWYGREFPNSHSSQKVSECLGIKGDLKRLRDSLDVQVGSPPSYADVMKKN
ncbi:hypothetical protein BDQ17DRAFT_1433584 [Cyathus striatus]|nr:hypothetical protein BDQ17DRAFT_1433584 [Cyathus striatus]